VLWRSTASGLRGDAFQVADAFGRRDCCEATWARVSLSLLLRDPFWGIEGTAAEASNEVSENGLGKLGELDKINDDAEAGEVINTED
jgi:hypothetical protein